MESFGKEDRVTEAEVDTHFRARSEILCVAQRVCCYLLFWMPFPTIEVVYLLPDNSLI